MVRPASRLILIILIAWYLGRFPSANHRVTAPLRENSRSSAPSRYSIVYFAAPESTDIISPQPSLVERAGKRVYDPITFGDYCLKMMAATQVMEKA
jgi:isopenicillin N synthase-like dioxygenase